MKPARICLLFVAATACCLFPLTHAQAAMVVLGGGFAQECTAAATALGSPGSNTAITGSRIGYTPVEICTKAIQEEALGSYDIAGTYNNRGVLLFAEGKHEAALADFEQALALVDYVAEMHMNRGLTLGALQRWADSIPSFDRAIELQGQELERIYFNRAIAHEETGNLRQAYYDYLKAAELDPEWEEPKLQLQRFSVRTR